MAHPSGPRLRDAPDEYDRADEQIFRRELETALYLIVALMQGVSVGTNAATSLYSKREARSGPPVGVVIF